MRGSVAEVLLLARLGQAGLGRPRAVRDGVTREGLETRRRRRRFGTATGADRTRSGHPACRWFTRRSWCSRMIHLRRCSRSSIRYRRLQSVPVTGTVPANGGRGLTQSSVLTNRRRISSHHAHQKDSSMIPRAMAGAMKLTPLNRADRPSCRWVARQVSRILRCLRQDSNLRRPA